MAKREIKTAEAPAAIGCYSQAIKTSSGLYFSGQIPLDPNSMQLVAESFKPQARQVMSNIEAVLVAAGLDWPQVVKLNVYLTDLADFGDLNELFEEYLSKPYPARAVVQVAALPRGAMIEIDGFAAPD